MEEENKRESEEEKKSAKERKTGEGKMSRREGHHNFPRHYTQSPCAFFYLRAHSWLSSFCDYQNCSLVHSRSLNNRILKGYVS